MEHSRAGVWLRLFTALVLVASMAVSARAALAQDDDSGGGDASVYVHGGSTSTVSVIDFNASGGTGTSTADGGTTNTVVNGGTAGNGGDATAAATGGALTQPGTTVVDPATGEETFVPGVIDTGGNAGNDVLVGNTVGGSGAHGGDAVVAIFGGEMSVVTTVNVSALGGVATANANGGNNNLIVAPIGSAPTAGVGGTALASATGGALAIGDVVTGGNVGTVITVGDTVGGDSDVCGCGEGGDAIVTIDGGSLTASSVLNLSVDGGESEANAIGGDNNVITVTDDDGLTTAVEAFEVSELAAQQRAAESEDEADGTSSVAAIGPGANTGAVITVGDTFGGDGFNGDGGDAVVDVVGGDLTSHAFSEEGNGYGGNNHGGFVTIGTTSGGDGSGGGAGGDALVGVEVGDITALAASAEGTANSGDNHGGRITVDDVTGGDGDGGQGGDATVLIKGTDITADATAGGLSATDDDGDDDGADAQQGDANVSVGTGGTANAEANAGTFTIGDSDAGGNVGAVISVGDVTGGDGNHGDGGDATVLIDGGSITTGVGLEVSLDGGTATASAVGGDDNSADLGDDDGVTANVGTGGDANAEANGGDITIGDLLLGDNVGAVISVGDVTGGAGCACGDGGDALVALEGTDITATVLLSLSADGGVATAYADGGDGNSASVYASGVYGSSIDGVTVNVGTGGSANAEANAGDITIGDLVVGRNAGSVFTVGDVTGADGSHLGDGGRATVIIDGGSITSTIDLDISTDGGVATAYANGGSDNSATVYAGSVYDASVGDVTVNVGNGGDANAEANGGNVVIGDLVAGENQGSIVTVESLEGVPGEGGGQDLVWDVEGTDIVSTIVATISLEGGVATAYANGGDGNTVAIDVTGVYGATAGGATVDVGEGGSANADANAGDATLGTLVSGRNVGSFSAIIEGVAADDDGDDCDDDCDDDCKDDCPKDDHDDCDCPDDKKDDGKNGDGAKGSAAVSSLPNTGAGVIQGQTGTSVLVLLAAALALTGAAFALRRRLA